MNVGNYVRTKSGQIHKITDLKGHYENGKLIEDKQSVYIDGKPSGWVYWQFKDFVVKSSPNIIDLIEVGDYVNGYKVLNVLDFNDNSKMLSLEKIYDSKITSEDIKSIVTKEQFESMEYNLENN